MEPPRHAQDVGVWYPRIFRYAGIAVLTVDVSWTGITMRPATSCIATTSTNRTGQEVSHSDPHVGGLSKPLAWSHGVLHDFQISPERSCRRATNIHAPMKAIMTLPQKW